MYSVLERTESWPTPKSARLAGMASQVAVHLWLQGIQAGGLHGTPGAGVPAAGQGRACPGHGAAQAIKRAAEKRAGPGIPHASCGGVTAVLLAMRAVIR